MRTTWIVSTVLAGAVAVGQGAPPLPSNYQVTFENAWVKVTAVRYAPLEKVPAHAHTPHPSAYVYLNDGPPVIFKHAGEKGTAATRAATKAGAFRVYRGLEEVHEVENTGNAPSEFLRVELKTAPREPGTFWGKYERPSAPASEPLVHFNHPQVRISRVWLMAGQGTEIAASSEPVLLVGLAKGGAGMSQGEVKWIDPSTRARLTNTSAAPIDLLQFDFRTRPAETRQ